MSNEQTFIESGYIARHASTSKRKPDIIATFTSTLRKYYTIQPKASFGDWVQLVGDGCLSELTSRKGQWPDIHQSWELDVARKEDPNLHGKDTRRQDSMQPPLSDRKRRSDETLSGDKKRARFSQRNSESTPFHALDKEHNLVPDLRCAYYAIERLRATCDVTHSMVVLLEGKLKLSRHLLPSCVHSNEMT